MRTRIILAVVAVLAVALGFFLNRLPRASPPSEQLVQDAIASIDQPPTSLSLPPLPTVSPTPPAASHSPQISIPAPDSGRPMNRAERLAEIRERFRALAAGDPVAAMRASRELADTERETALLALVTEWTRGELTRPQQRARAISLYGLEAGLGVELARHPQLALAWAAELTEGAGRAAVLGHAAVSLLDAQPAPTAIALGEKLGGEDRQRFIGFVFSSWAEKDTQAALQWANQLDASEREAATKAIQSVAPVGIGAVLGAQDGYVIVNGILPGAPAEAGGQIRAGDRIVAIAQGDDAFVDARGMPLKNVVEAIRGAPGTVVRLQVLSADAPAYSAPRTISVMRGQINLKQ
jgi:hypothetical protein